MKRYLAERIIGYLNGFTKDVELCHIDKLMWKSDEDFEEMFESSRRPFDLIIKRNDLKERLYRELRINYLHGKLDFSVSNDVMGTYSNEAMELILEELPDLGIIVEKRHFDIHYTVYVLACKPDRTFYWDKTMRQAGYWDNLVVKNYVVKN